MQEARRVRGPSTLASAEFEPLRGIRPARFGGEECELAPSDQKSHQPRDPPFTGPLSAPGAHEDGKCGRDTRAACPASGPSPVRHRIPMDVPWILARGSK